jgi:hypothetical protein
MPSVPFDTSSSTPTTMAWRSSPAWSRVEICRHPPTFCTRPQITFTCSGVSLVFDHDLVERLQKQLARELGTDPAATPVTQNTRLPGFFNHKRAQPHLVTVEYRDVDARYGPDDFPPLTDTGSPARSIEPREPKGIDLPVIERARRYVASVPPAIAGQHGDVHTFRVCCRLTRGFALDDEQALHVLAEWNARCQPPWSEAELLDKLHRTIGSISREVYRMSLMRSPPTLLCTARMAPEHGADRCARRTRLSNASGRAHVS